MVIVSPLRRVVIWLSIWSWLNPAKVLADPNALADEAETKLLPSPPLEKAVCALPAFCGAKVYTIFKKMKVIKWYYTQPWMLMTTSRWLDETKRVWSNYYEIIIRWEKTFYSKCFVRSPFDWIVLKCLRGRRCFQRSVGDATQKWRQQSRSKRHLQFQWVCNIYHHFLFIPSHSSPSYAELRSKYILFVDQVNNRKQCGESSAPFILVKIKMISIY